MGSPIGGSLTGLPLLSRYGSIGAWTPTTTLSGALNASQTNMAILTAAVAPQTPRTYAAQPSGTVTFYNSTGSSLGIVTLTAGGAMLTTPTYSGSHSFYAIYNDDGNNAASGQSKAVPLTFSVAPRIPFATAQTKYPCGQSFPLTAMSKSAGMITYSVVSGPVTVSPTTAVAANVNVTVTVTCKGLVTLQANQAAAPGYNAAVKEAGLTATMAASTTMLTATAASQEGNSPSSTSTRLRVITRPL